MKIKMCYGTLAFLLLCCACSTEWEIPPLDSSDRVDEDVLNPVIQEARNYSEQYVKDYHSVFEKREMLPTKGNANGLQPVWSKAQVKKRSGFLKVEVPMLSENPKKQHVNYFIQGKKYELEVEPSTRMVMAKHREDGRYGCYLTSSLILPSISGATADDTIMIDHSPDGRMLIVGGHIDGEVKLFQKTAENVATAPVVYELPIGGVAQTYASGIRLSDLECPLCGARIPEGFGCPTHGYILDDVEVEGSTFYLEQKTVRNLCITYMDALNIHRLRGCNGVCWEGGDALGMCIRDLFLWGTGTALFDFFEEVRRQTSNFWYLDNYRGYRYLLEVCDLLHINQELMNRTDSFIWEMTREIALFEGINYDSPNCEYPPIDGWESSIYTADADPIYAPSSTLTYEQKKLLSYALREFVEKSPIYRNMYEDLKALEKKIKFEINPQALEKQQANAGYRDNKIIFKDDAGIKLEYLEEEMLHAVQDLCIYGQDYMDGARKNVEFETKVVQDIILTQIDSEDGTVFRGGMVDDFAFHTAYNTWIWNNYLNIDIIVEEFQGMCKKWPGYVGTYIEDFEPYMIVSYLF